MASLMINWNIYYFINQIYMHLVATLYENLKMLFAGQDNLLMKMILKVKFICSVVRVKKKEEKKEKNMAQRHCAYWKVYFGADPNPQHVSNNPWFGKYCCVLLWLPMLGIVVFRPIPFREVTFIVWFSNKDQTWLAKSMLSFTQTLHS